MTLHRTTLTTFLAASLVLGACSSGRGPRVLEPSDTSTVSAPPTSAVIATDTFDTVVPPLGSRQIEFTSQTLRLAVGDSVFMRDPEFSPGIGDNWTLVTEPDTAVAAIEEHLVDCGAPGCTGKLDETITAIGAGSTTVVLQYCFRSSGPACAPRPGEQLRTPVELKITAS